MAETPADPPEPEAASRVIIVAPFGADMAVLDRIVAAHGLRPVTAPAENGALEERLAAGWDILVLTAEACRPRILSCVAARLLDLPVWSAPPVVILSETDIAGRKAAGLLREARPDLPVSILIRPCDEVEIASALSVARQSRAGQLRIRDLLEDRERAVEHSGFLYHELSHRVSNLFAMIKALAGQTLRHTPDTGTFLGAFNDRMDALAGIYGAMRDEDWETTELDAIVRGAVLPLLADTEARERFTADGPPARLVADVVTSLGLAVHELANNSRKHGALSVAQGRVSVTWSRGAGDNGLDMQWQETGGPEVHPPSREGFGTTVIRSALKGEGASVDLDYRAEGLVCRFRIPQRFLGQAPGKAPTRPSGQQFLAAHLGGFDQQARQPAFDILARGLPRPYRLHKDRLDEPVSRFGSFHQHPGGQPQPRQNADDIVFANIQIVQRRSGHVTDTGYGGGLVQARGEMEPFGYPDVAVGAVEHDRCAPVVQAVGDGKDGFAANVDIENCHVSCGRQLHPGFDAGRRPDDHGAEIGKLPGEFGGLQPVVFDNEYAYTFKAGHDPVLTFLRGRARRTQRGRLTHRMQIRQMTLPRPVNAVRRGFDPSTMPILFRIPLQLPDHPLPRWNKPPACPVQAIVFGNEGGCLTMAHLSRFAGAAGMVCLFAGAGLADTGAVTLSVGSNEEFGAYIVGPEGQPVYAFLTNRGASDGQDPLDSCNADCREEWPPLVAQGEIRASEELDAYLVGTTEDEDGQPVVSYAGQPLFSFYRDEAGGAPGGQGIFSFGGYWALLNPSGVPIRSDTIPEPDSE